MRVNDRPPHPFCRARIVDFNFLYFATVYLRGGFRLSSSVSQSINWPSRSCLELVWRMVSNFRLITSVRGPGYFVTNGLVSDGFYMLISWKCAACGVRANFIRLTPPYHGVSGRRALLVEDKPHSNFYIKSDGLRKLCQLYDSNSQPAELARSRAGFRVRCRNHCAKPADIKI